MVFNYKYWQGLSSKCAINQILHNHICLFFHSHSMILNIITVKIILLWRTYHLSYYSVIVFYLFYCSKFYNCFWCKYILLLALFLFYCITYEELLMSSNMSLEKTLYFKSSLSNKQFLSFPQLSPQNPWQSAIHLIQVKGGQVTV